MTSILVAFGIGFGFVTAYYLLDAAVKIAAQKYFHYDKPTSVLYKIIAFPMALPSFFFDLMISSETRSVYVRGKEGYLRKEAILFCFNVILFYSVAAYFLFLR